MTLDRFWHTLIMIVLLIDFKHMDIQVDFDSENTQQVLLTLLREAIGKGRVFVCDECEDVLLKEERSSVDAKGAILCRDCAKRTLGSVGPSAHLLEDYQHQQVKLILEKISETEKEYNELIEASRTGVDWEHEIESRRLRIQSLKRQLLDVKHKTNH